MQNKWIEFTGCAALISSVVGLVGWVLPVSPWGEWGEPPLVVASGLVFVASLLASRYYYLQRGSQPLQARLSCGGQEEGSLTSSEGNRGVKAEAGGRRLVEAMGVGGWQCVIEHGPQVVRAEVLGPDGQEVFVGCKENKLVLNVRKKIYTLQAGKLSVRGVLKAQVSENVCRVDVREKWGRVVVKVGDGYVRLQARVSGQCQVRLQEGPEGGTLFAEALPPAGPGPFQAIGNAWRERRRVHQALDAQKRAIEGLVDPDAQRQALGVWREELEMQLNGQVAQEAQRDNHDFFRLSRRLVMAAFCMTMIMMCGYIVVATPKLSHPLPGWQWFLRLRGGPLFWVGGATGILAITIARGLVLRFNPDRTDRAYARLLGNRGRLVLLWLGGMPMAAVIGVFVDMALGYVFAQALTSYVYRGDPVVFAAIVSVIQMPFGGIFYLIRSAALFGFPSSPEERALQWVEAQLKRLDGGQRQPAAFIRWIWWVVVGGGPLFYSGSLILLIHWPRLVSAAQAALIGGLTTLSGVAMGLMFALLASLFARMLREGRGADPSGKRQDLGTALIGVFGNLSPLVGTLAVLIWGRGYSSHDAALLGAAYQQFLGILISTLSFMYMVVMQARRRQGAQQTQPVPATQPQAAYPPLPSAHAQSNPPAVQPRAAYPPIPQPSPAPQQPTRPV